MNIPINSGTYLLLVFVFIRATRLLCRGLWTAGLPCVDGTWFSGRCVSLPFMPWSRGETLPSQGSCTGFCCRTSRPEGGNWGWGRGRKSAQGYIQNPLPGSHPPFLTIHTTLFQNAFSYSQDSNHSLKFKSNSLWSFNSQHIPQKCSPSTPLFTSPKPPQTLHPTIPYPLHSQLTSEPTSFRKPSPIKGARVRIPSSPRHHEQTTTPPILAVHIHQNKTKNNKINKNKNKKKRRGNVYVCPSCCFSLSAPRGQGPCLPNGLCSA